MQARDAKRRDLDGAREKEKKSKYRCYVIYTV